MTLRRLAAADADAYVALRREALERDPFAFGASLDDDQGLQPEHVRASLSRPDQQTILGWFDGDTLAAIVGLVRQTATKRRHAAHIWGMYVATSARNRGIGRALLEAALAHARAWTGVEQVHLSVTEPADAARRLYAAVGFREWGRQPRALQWSGRFVDELHLVLTLE